MSTYQENNRMVNACNSKTFQAKEAKLRRILEHRKAAPVVSCAPGKNSDFDVCRSVYYEFAIASD